MKVVEKLLFCMFEQNEYTYLLSWPGIDTRADSAFLIWPLRTLQYKIKRVLF